MQHENILIVGAGPTGLTAALLFARKGIKVDIVEKRKGPSQLSRAVGIMPASLNVLGEEIAKKIWNESIPFTKIKMHIGQQKHLDLNLKETVTPYSVLTGMPQNRTEEIISDALAELGVLVQYGVELVQIENVDDHVEVEFGNTNTSKYDWVIACDGTESICRRQLGIDYIGYDVDGTWSIADVELESPHDFNSISIWMKLPPNNGAVISLAIGSERVRVISTEPDCLAMIPVPFTIKKIYRKGTFEVAVRQVDSYIKGKVLLAGDAAHCHSPVGGRGMNLGIDDAAAAVKAILHDTTDSYSKERHAVGKEVIRKSESARKMIMSKNPLLKATLKILLSFANNSEWIQKLALKQVSKL